MLLMEMLTSPSPQETNHQQQEEESEMLIELFSNKLKAVPHMVTMMHLVPSGVSCSSLLWWQLGGKEQ